jgi:hypothetical protein
MEKMIEMKAAEKMLDDAVEKVAQKVSKKILK